ncbi:hypothetical protein RGQ29_031596 [Quercus rubra]|uniref:Protein-S-isoprenylcysteine O-methyltransferase n=1 Tax=Quercus rubra TaxID=3512 RepID=A0AAN7EM19_QUERU|nr:hypothetical protein RGQ29_031596 [Quercus rubra]
MTEIFTYPAYRQLCQMFVAIFFFQTKTISWQMATLFSLLENTGGVSNLGLAVFIVDEIIRKTSIISAGQAFTHLIKINHEEHHKPITHGIYKCVRHPACCGFFIWSIGTQINAL